MFIVRWFHLYSRELPFLQSPNVGISFALGNSSSKLYRNIVYKYYRVYSLVQLLMRKYELTRLGIYTAGGFYIQNYDLS